MKTLGQLLTASLISSALLFLAGCEDATLPVARQGLPSQAEPGWSAVQPQPLDPQLLQPSKSAFRLGPGDMVTITVPGDLVATDDAIVGPDGKIYFSFLPGIDVGGLSLAEAAERIDDAFGPFVRERPRAEVTLKSVSSQQVWMLGRLNTPGVYPLDRPTSLLEAIAGAGGLGDAASESGPRSESADLAHSFLIRDGHLLPVDFQGLVRDGDLSQNVYLHPGDFIFVPSIRAARIHILGAVVQPRSESFDGSLTVVQAIALAGGTTVGAVLPNVAILRGSLTHPQISIVAVDSVLKGRAPDVRLEAGDIVYVPNSPDRVLVRYVNLVLDTFVRTVGVNEGAYAIDRKASPITVGVTVAP